MNSIEIKCVDNQFDLSFSSPINYWCTYVFRDEEDEKFFLQHLSRHVDNFDKSEALTTLQKLELSLTTDFECGSPDQPGWEEECKALKLDLVLVKAIDRVMLELAIRSEFSGRLERVKGFIDEFHECCPLPIQKSGAIYVALRNIQAVCVNAAQDLKGNQTKFARKVVNGILMNLRRIDSELRIRPTRPIAQLRIKASPYLQNGERAKIKKKYQVYEVTPQILSDVLVHPELVPLAMELYAGIEEAKDLVIAVRNLQGNNVTYARILEAVDQISDFCNDAYSYLRRKSTHKAYWGNPQLTPQRINYALSNPTLVEIAGQLRQYRKVYDSLMEFEDYRDPILAAKKFIIYTQHQFGRSALSPPEFNKAIADTLKSFRSSENFDPKQSTFSAHTVAKYISQQIVPEREQDALHEIGRLLNAKLHSVTITPDGFVQRVKQAYYYPVLNQRILNALESTLKAAELSSDTPVTEVVQKVCDQLRRDDYGPVADENIIYFDQQIEFEASPSQLARLKAYKEECWAEVKSKRRYQVPSKGRAVLLASHFLSEKLNLISLRFVQEDIEPPGVFVEFKFEFGSLELEYPLEIGVNGNVSGFHEGIKNEGIQAVVEAVAVSYYRDLVLPGSSHEPQSSRQVVPSRAKKASSTSKSPRMLPRPQIKQTNNVYDIWDWQIAQEKASNPSNVTGHPRRMPDGFIASPKKHREAKEKADVELQPGETWVNEHLRGKTTGYDSLQTDSQGDLIEETIFSAPTPASDQLLNLLN